MRKIVKTGSKMWNTYFKRKAPEQQKVSKKLKLNKGVIPSKYREYWFLDDGRVVSEYPGEEQEYFYCVATSIDMAYELYEESKNNE